MKHQTSLGSRGNNKRANGTSIPMLLLVALVTFGAAACNTATSECNGDSAGAILSGSGGGGGDGGGGAGGLGVGGWSPFDASPPTSVTTGGGCTSPLDCDDGNACTLNYCMNGICSNPDDTMFSVCGEMGMGHCFRALCCEGCIDMKAHACVLSCPSGQSCSPLGVCVS